MAQKEKASKKKANSGNFKSMNAVRQKLKKISKQYDALITAYKKVHGDNRENICNHE